MGFGGRVPGRFRGSSSALGEPSHRARPERVDVLHGSSPAAQQQSSPPPPAEELSPGELRVLRYLPTNLFRPEVAGERPVSLNTVSPPLRSLSPNLHPPPRPSPVPHPP